MTDYDGTVRAVMGLYREQVVMVPLVEALAVLEEYHSVLIRFARRDDVLSGEVLVEVAAEIREGIPQLARALAPEGLAMLAEQRHSPDPEVRLMAAEVLANVAAILKERGLDIAQFAAPPASDKPQ